MKRAGVQDTQRMLPRADPTDPGGRPAFAADDPPPPPTEEERLEAERVIEAFKGATPRRPLPSQAKRASSDGGASVAYSAIAAPAPSQAAQQERALAQLSEMTRHIPVPPPTLPHIQRLDIVTVPGAVRRGRRTMWLTSIGLVSAGLAAVLVVLLLLRRGSESGSTGSAVTIAATAVATASTATSSATVQAVASSASVASIRESPVAAVATLSATGSASAPARAPAMPAPLTPPRATPHPAPIRSHDRILDTLDKEDP
jgi:hypothetical protein